MSDITTLRAMLFARCPEFETVDTSKLTIIDTYLEDNQEDIDSSIFGTKTDRAIVYLTAHKLTLFNPTSIDVSLLKNKVGSISKERKKWDKVEKETFYGSSSNNSSKSTNTDYNTTVYGQEYWNLRQLVKPISVFLA